MIVYSQNVNRRLQNKTFNNQSVVRNNSNVIRKDIQGIVNESSEKNAVDEDHRN